MPALGHSEKGRLGGRRKSGAERCPRSPGRPVPKRSAPAPPPPPPQLPLSSRLASLLRRGRAEAESRCSSAGHAPSLPGLRGILQAGPRLPARLSPGRPAPPLLSRLRPFPSPGSSGSRRFPALARRIPSTYPPPRPWRGRKFCVLKRRRFPARRGGLLGGKPHSV